MPRAYNELERQVIGDKLIEAGRKRFAQFGLKKTSIDEIVSDVSIGKGSFYQFFPSKQALFFEILNRLEASSHARLLALSKAEVPNDRLVSDFFHAISDNLKNNPLLKIITRRDEFEYFMRSLPEVDIAEHRKRDRAFYERIFKKWIRDKKIKPTSTAALMGSITGLLLWHQNADVLGRDFDRTVDLFIDSLSRHISA